LSSLSENRGHLFESWEQLRDAINPMSVQRALEMIRSSLPPELIAGIDEVARDSGDVQEFQVGKFSLSKVINPQNMRNIARTRLKGALKHNNPVAEDLRSTVAFLDDSLASPNANIWLAYYVLAGRVVDFLIDVDRGKFLRTEYEQRLWKED
jgi:hypothetical protein